MLHSKKKISKKVYLGQTEHVQLPKIVLSLSFSPLWSFKLCVFLASIQFSPKHKSNFLVQDEKAVVYTTYTFVKNYLLPSTFIYHHIMFAIVFICGCLLVLILACMYYIWQYMKQKMGTHKYFRVRKFSWLFLSVYLQICHSELK